ncbi:hypothetical protein QR680_014677 [Steinernema hermaphroditum]|uniref:Uncharacterized protein n=1 Tax=Steinernema hermaphroditum TaxID=289476 RepID=A0AA39I9T7_9BILA|nr:hypothetical protein QR680_014677 [Steinernema hermaphroditum]
MASIVDDDRLFLFLAVVAFCNLVPLVAFFAYLIASSFVIVATALLAEVLSLIFGLAVFVPIFTFSTLSAFVITGMIILSAAVKGVLMCGDKPLVNTKVKLWDNDAGPDLDDLLEEGHTDGQGQFHLSGHTSELTTIDPILKIYHDCDDGIMPCQRKVSFIIPDSYVSSGATPSKVFDIGTVNMQIIFKSEERDCLNRA